MDNREFSGGPMVKTPCFQHRGHGFNPYLGPKIPHATWPKSKKKYRQFFMYKNHHIIYN